MCLVVPSDLISNQQWEDIKEFAIRLPRYQQVKDPLGFKSVPKVAGEYIYAGNINVAVYILRIVMHKEHPTFCFLPIHKARQYIATSRKNMKQLSFALS